MRRFGWAEVSGDKDCLQCSVLGETSILKRELRLLHGNEASVKFSCPVCGFSSVGVVSVDGSEVEPITIARRALPKEPPRYNAPEIADPLTKPEYKAPKTDAEALSMAFGEMLEPEDFIQLVGEAFEPQIKSGDWVAKLHKTPTTIEMGSIKIANLLVEYIHPVEGTVWQRMFSSKEGTPDVQAEMDAAVSTCLALIAPPKMPRAQPSRASVPRGPVQVIPNGYNGIPEVGRAGNGDVVRDRLLASFQGGG